MSLFGETEAERFPATGVVNDNGPVRFTYEAGTEAPFVEHVLVHELSHLYQTDERLRTFSENRDLRFEQTTEGRYLSRAVLEGAPTFIADEYVREYLPDTRTQSEEIDARWDSFGISRRAMWSGHYFGAQYMHARFESPRQLHEVYENPPQTTAQLLHPERAPDPATLSVDSNTSNSPWDLSNRDVRGELYLRVLLSPELGDEAAAKASTGWGMDRDLVYYRNADASHAWVLRWDDTQNATEFQSAFESFLGARAEPTGNGTWTFEDHTFRVERPDPKTVTVVWGEPDFVGNTTVESEDGTVIVTPPETVSSTGVSRHS
ncbi:hypothetical protein [Haloarchaeobius sp. DYHT-AS-18]|uniref:hypothetical protein n=1 Tax=Haloarchaeobius sp. DYHT-AS-18 TaxID=3446117 RepID=UPI003EB6C4CF